MNNGLDLATDAHIQAVVFAVITLDLQFSQIVVAQELCKRLDEADIAVVGSLFSHIFLGPLSIILPELLTLAELIRQDLARGKAAVA
jgi:hypothetical protein